MVAGHGNDSQADPTAGRAVNGFIYILVKWNVVIMLIIAVFFVWVDLPKYRLRNTLRDLSRVNHRVFNVNGYILLLIC